MTAFAKEILCFCLIASLNILAVIKGNSRSRETVLPGNTVRLKHFPKIHRQDHPFEHLTIN
jgi:hypothetical protein